MLLADDQQILLHIWCPEYHVETSLPDQQERLAGLVGGRCKSFGTERPGQQSRCVELKALHSKGECQRAAWLLDPLLLTLYPLSPSATQSELRVNGLTH